MECTGIGRAGQRLTHVRWVFPAPALSRLAGRLVVGRDGSCDTVLEGTEISRRHAELSVDGPVATVRDLDSRNGLHVNGRQRIEARLELGDVLRCGEWIGIVVGEPDPHPFGEIAPGWLGGAALLAAAEPARRIAGDLGVERAFLVQGEPGTGKEGLARAVVGWRRRPGPFLAVSCGALPDHLMEAELFGNGRGPVNGDRTSHGLFGAAQGGTLFLDEILELPPAAQDRLLRVLVEREVRPAGDAHDVPVDVQIIASTQEPLGPAALQGRFRADLQARLEGLTVVLPALRARREDIVPLFLHFLRQHAGGRPPRLEAKLAEALCLHDWPLNVRELSLLARRLVAQHGHEPALKKVHLPERMLATPLPLDPDAPPVEARRRRPTDDSAEFEKLVQALRSHGGGVARAAAAIGVSRARAYRLLSAHPDFSLASVRP